MEAAASFDLQAGSSLRRMTLHVKKHRFGGVMVGHDSEAYLGLAGFITPDHRRLLFAT